MPGICSREPGQEQLVDQGRGRIQGIYFSCQVCLDGRKNEEVLLETNVRIPAPHQRQKNVVCNAFSRELSYFFLPSLPTFTVGGLNSHFLGFPLLTSGTPRSSTSKLATFSSSSSSTAFSSTGASVFVVKDWGEMRPEAT